VKKQWHIGCSGFHYKEWKEFFYPGNLPQSKWFDFYSRQFNSLELNVTFYRYPTLQALKSWYDKAPDNFSFSAKMPRSITHFKRFQDTERMIIDFYTLLDEGLKDKLGCVLVQLPGQYVYSQSNLEKILYQLHPSFNNVIEFRHESWWRKDVQKKLALNNISFCGVSFPNISFDDAIINTALSYYRFHGVPKLFYSEYDQEFLRKIFKQLNESRKAKNIFTYFNNTASLAALHNARYLKQLIEE
jgi:uncharacterized protein YecE (DUF72 family)